jgi:hypothetical protein
VRCAILRGALACRNIQRNGLFSAFFVDCRVLVLRLPAPRVKRETPGQFLYLLIYPDFDLKAHQFS